MRGLSVRWGRRVLLVAVAATLAAGLGVGDALADVPGGVANFPQQGSRVYPIDAVGLGCRLAGYCDGAAAALDDHATPQYLSLRAGEGVGASCTAGGLVRVRGFFGGSELADGWAYSSDLALRRPLDEC
jgi:hypothetical protein